jgi:hypothetical protein
MSLERYAKGLKQGFKVGYFSNQNASGLVHLHVSRLFKKLSRANGCRVAV